MAASNGNYLSWTFIVLALIIFALGVIVMWLARGGTFDSTGGDSDGNLVGMLFVVEGIGFLVFGLMSRKENWEKDSPELAA